jgi:hypothetical protein
MNIWIAATQRGNRWRSQNQIADSLELQEKNFHPPLTMSGGFQTAAGDLEVACVEQIIASSASRFRMRPAIALENGPR